MRFICSAVELTLARSAAGAVLLCEAAELNAKLIYLIGSTTGMPARTGYRAAWDPAFSHAVLHRQPPTDEAPFCSTGGVSPSVRANVRSTYARSGSAATRA